MKKYVILTSILALTACGGGSGGHHGANDITIPNTNINGHNGDSGNTTNPNTPTYNDSTIVTRDMLNNPNDLQARELAQKLKTIEYVENNLGSLMQGAELSGTSSLNTGRSATAGKVNNGLLTVADINARYNQASGFFDILKKVLNAPDGANITNKEIKIAYSLSAAKPYDELTQYDLPGINLEETAEGTVINIDTFFSSIQISITDKAESNINLQDSITEDIAQDIPEITNPDPIDPNATLINSNLLDNISDIHDVENMFQEFVFHINSDGKIDSIKLDDDEKFNLDRVDNSSVFKSDHTIWFFDVSVQKTDGRWKEISLEGLDAKITDRNELANQIQQILSSDEYNNVSTEEKNRVLNEIRTNPDFGTWTGAIFNGDIHSLGKTNGLQYSDFGYYTLDNYYFTFTYQGGMDSKKITPVDMPQSQTLVFRGTAAGELQQNLEVDGVDMVGLENNNRPIVTNTGAATLTYNNGTETINMPFNDWYNVTVTKKIHTNDVDHIKSIDFNDGDNISSEWRVNKLHVNYDNEPYYQDYMHDGLPETNAAWDDNVNDVHDSVQTTMTTTYYGDNNNPIEATGFVNHVDEHEYRDNEGKTIERQVWFEVVFGGTKQSN